MLLTEWHMDIIREDDDTWSVEIQIFSGASDSRFVTETFSIEDEAHDWIRSQLNHQLEIEKKNNAASDAGISQVRTNIKRETA